jgi:hypothetical protein
MRLTHRAAFNAGALPAIAAYIVGVAVYVDTVELFSWKPPDEWLDGIRRLHRGSIKVEPVKSTDGSTIGYRTSINDAPPVKVLRALARLQTDHRFVLSRVDVAVDLITRSVADAEWVKAYVHKHLLRRWRRHGPLETDHGTDYDALGGPGRNVSIYVDESARTVAGHQPCAHVELRAKGRGAILRSGFDDIKTLMAADLVAYLNRYLALTDVDAKAFAQEIVRRSLADERQRFLKRKRRPVSRLAEQYRSRIHDRLWALVRRLNLDTAQAIKIQYPGKAARWHRHPLIVVINGTGDPSDGKMSLGSMNA